MSARVGLAALLTAAAACVPAARTTLPGCPGTNGRAPSPADYFPARTFDAREADGHEDGREDGHDAFGLQWFGGELAARDEPVLSCPRPAPAAAYRLLFLPSFAPSWVVRVERTADGAALQATKLPAAERVPATARPNERRSRRLSPAEWERLAAAAAAAGFWSLPAPETRPGNDGETWIVEGLGPDGYHAVARWEPKEGSAFRALGGTLLDLAGLGQLAVVTPPSWSKPTAPEDLR